MNNFAYAFDREENMSFMFLKECAETDTHILCGRKDVFITVRSITVHNKSHKDIQYYFTQ